MNRPDPAPVEGARTSSTAMIIGEAVKPLRPLYDRCDPTFLEEIHRQARGIEQRLRVCNWQELNALGIDRGHYDRHWAEIDIDQIVEAIIYLGDFEVDHILAMGLNQVEGEGLGEGRELIAAAHEAAKRIHEFLRRFDHADAQLRRDEEDLASRFSVSDIEELIGSQLPRVVIQNAGAQIRSPREDGESFRAIIGRIAERIEPILRECTWKRLAELGIARDVEEGFEGPLDLGKIRLLVLGRFPQVILEGAIARLRAEDIENPAQLIDRYIPDLAREIEPELRSADDSILSREFGIGREDEPGGELNSASIERALFSAFALDIIQGAAQRLRSSAGEGQKRISMTRRNAEARQIEPVLRRCADHALSELKISRVTGREELSEPAWHDDARVTHGWAVSQTRAASHDPLAELDLSTIVRQITLALEGKPAYPHREPPPPRSITVSTASTSRPNSFALSQSCY